MTPPLFLGALTSKDILDLVLQGTLLGKIIYLVLLGLSVMSWAVMIEKGRLLARYRKGHLEFWRRYGQWRAGGLSRGDLLSWAQRHRGLPLTNLLLESESESTQEGVRNTAERVAYVEMETMERYMILLSTTVTIGPFLGLLGTVWGIMTAFWDMASLRSASLTVVAPGIAEALITTVAGLGAAIPAVVFYNLFVRKIDLIGNEMERLRTLMEGERAARLEEPAATLREARRPEIHDKERIR